MNSTRPLVDADGLVGMPLGPVYERRLIRNLLSMAAKDKRVLFGMLRWLLLSMGYTGIIIPNHQPNAALCDI